MKKQLQLFVILTAALGMVFYFFPIAADVIFAQEFFPLFSKVTRWISSSTELPLIVPLLLLLPGGLFLLISRSKSIWRFCINLLFSFAVIASIFLWSWGFFYFTSGIHGNEKAPEVSTTQLASWGEKIAHSIERAPTAELVPHDSISKWVGEYLGEKNKAFSPIETARCKAFNDHYFLRKIGIGGIYMPFTTEGYTSNQQSAFTLCFTQAHELAHVYGISNEGEADYVAYRALMRSKNEHAHYAAQFELLRTIRSLLKTADEAKWLTVVKATPRQVNADLLYLRFQNILHPEFFQGLGSEINNQYLKAMGVHGGIASYDEMINWIFVEDEPLSN